MFVWVVKPREGCVLVPWVLREEVDCLSSRLPWMVLWMWELCELNDPCAAVPWPLNDSCAAVPWPLNDPCAAVPWLLNDPCAAVPWLLNDPCAAVP